MSNQKILQRGAEALIILKDKETITKRRIKKSYRLPLLDERLRRQRTRTELKLLEKISKIIPVPRVVEVNENKKEISMDFLKGKKLSENLDKFPMNRQKDICKAIGQNVAKLHDSNVIHGDLTTSNMIYVEDKKTDAKNRLSNNKKSNEISFRKFSGVGGRDNFKIYFIDFGLGFISQKIEDKAVDLHLLKQALEAKHFNHWHILFDEVLKGYSLSKNHKIVLKQFEKVEKRGRYKDKY